MSHLDDMIDSIKKVIIVPIHPAGYPIIATFVVVTLLFFLMSTVLGWAGVVLSLWCVYFFRDPVRYTPVKDNLVISPADGVVSSIVENVPLPKELDWDDAEEYTRVSVFLNVFNVHVNRVPCSGVIKKVIYTPGKFLNASLDKASEDNERSAALVETSEGKLIGFVQIAGFVARRIICDLHENQEVETGERYGIIRFGSRADIYLPKGTHPLVSVGQTMVGGESVIADMKSKEKARQSEVRD